MRKMLLLIVLALLISACRPTNQTPQIQVTLVADGRERTFLLPAPTTIDEFLRDPDVDIQLGELDQVNPPLFTQISDGLQITVSRVSETTECETLEIPYQQSQVLNEGLNPGEQRVVQAGQNGTMEVCYRVTVVDGISRDRIETNRTEIRAAQNEIIYIGPTGEIEPVPIVGTIVYMNNANIWTVQGSSTNKRPLTTDGDLDQHVFAISDNGQRLLFTRKPRVSDSANTFNQLWMIADISIGTQPVSLVLDNILYADWIPDRDNTITYSSAERSDAAPGWIAFNDLWQMRIDLQTGDSLGVRSLLRRSGGGLYGWWGTRFLWSPDGTKLAWAQANKIGLAYIVAEEELSTDIFDDALLNFPVLRPVSDWSWRPTISWSPDGNQLLTTVHGPPIGSESPESSPAFNVAVADLTGSLNAVIVQNSGIWSSPQFSPFVGTSSSGFPKGYMAYLRSRDPFSSINGEYDLVVADRDGSNARVVFPESGRPGITAQQSIFQNREFSWSPDGKQIALIYQGDLWVVDIESSIAHQITLDGRSTTPLWTS